MFKKKQPIEETKAYKEQKEAAETPMVRNKVDIGEAAEEKQETPLEQVIIGMTEIEYRTHVLGLLMEIKDDLNQHKQL